MKKIILMTFATVFLLSNVLHACPYQAMADLDEKIKSSSQNLSKSDLSTVSKLRNTGKNLLMSGNHTESEQILNEALALFK